MTRTFSWSAALVIAALLAIVWTLWHNSLESTYDNRVEFCNFIKSDISKPDARGWAAAEHARHSTVLHPGRLDADHHAVELYHSIHTALDHYNAVPCRTRIRRPGPFG